MGAVEQMHMQVAEGMMPSLPLPCSCPCGFTGSLC